MFDWLILEPCPQVVGKDKNVLAIAWQAAPSVTRDGMVRLAVEGLESQRILMSLSVDGGRSWSPAFVVPTELPNATRSVRYHTVSGASRIQLRRTSPSDIAACTPCAGNDSDE